MKKVLLSVAALMIAGITFGQTKFGIVAGPNFSSATVKGANDSKETGDLLVGVRAGFTADLQLAAPDPERRQRGLRLSRLHEVVRRRGPQVDQVRREGHRSRP